jgi:hypothetical protein
MRAVSFLAIGAMLAPTFAPTVVAAQDRGAASACNSAIRYEVQDRYPQARGVRVLDSNTRDSGRNEATVTGRGEFEDRNGGESRFSFGCTYSYRSGRTFDLRVDDVSHKDGKNNGAAVAGLVLGAIVLGAIAASASKDKDRDDDWRRDDVWSPADGVRCNSRERVCHKDGRFSQKWTDRIFYR